MSAKNEEVYRTTARSDVAQERKDVKAPAATTEDAAKTPTDCDLLGFYAYASRRCLDREKERATRRTSQRAVKGLAARSGVQERLREV